MTDDDVGFERLARPLLELIQRITGLETTFVTQIDWAAQVQEVVVALNTSELEVPEGSVVEWSDSMCRLTFLSGREQSFDVGGDFPGSLGAEQLGMRTFAAVPILAGDATLGTVCAASRRAFELDPEMLASMRLVAEAMAFQMAMQLDGREQRQRAEVAEAMALTDSLTGLANRRAFTARLEEELSRSGRHGSSIAVLVIDVDRFKTVNDTHGHHAGDTVLVGLGDVLRKAARASDMPARLGGDEFAFLLPHSDIAGAEAVADRIANEFRLAVGGLELSCTLSIGISTSETTHRRSLLAAADKALYRSKANGRNRAEVWTGDCA